ncbi:putative integral membrane protein [Golovinomyces cichoracearum]|uniref:Putative integral membrane protein n=1 Tax=Golovinomyces cichoracearum TaxID=62708 RepID=A0A420IPX9_9PEZI|nr:putative integral membrane protein [Golovinomyces cichoracearum]
MKYEHILLPVISLIAALVALVLSVVVVVGNGKNESLQKFTTLSVNASTFLQDAVRVEDSSKYGSKRSEKRSVEDLIKELPSLLSPTLNLKSDSSGLGAQPKPTNTTHEAGDELFGELFDPVVGFFGNKLNSALNSFTSELKESLGIRQWYGLYLGTLCSADFSPNFKDPDATLSNLRCKSVGGFTSDPIFP